MIYIEQAGVLFISHDLYRTDLRFYSEELSNFYIAPAHCFYSMKKIMKRVHDLCSNVPIQNCSNVVFTSANCRDFRPDCIYRSAAI